MVKAQALEFSTQVLGLPLQGDLSRLSLCFTSSAWGESALSRLGVNGIFKALRSFLTLTFTFVHLYVCTVCVKCTCVPMCVGAHEGQRGSWILWNWSCGFEPFNMDTRIGALFLYKQQAS